MSREHIFIASAREVREDYAQVIAQHLSDAGFTVRRWWTEFEPGHTTLDRLLDLARDVDGAVFLCLGTEKVWYRGQEAGAPRDNVILEFGMFVNQIGRRAAIVLAGDDVRLPSDLEGLTYLRATDDVETLAERTVKHFRRIFSGAHTNPRRTWMEVKIEVDLEVADLSINSRTPDGWHQRALYVGTEGAKGWLAVVQEATYLSPTDKVRVREQALARTHNLNIRSYVSLGPGDGQLDRELAIAIDPSGRLMYFPVDISEGLLFRAARVVSQHAQVPIGVLGDFEERLAFIRLQLDKYIRSPALFSLLGNTLGNLDLYESTFLRQMCAWMTTSDYLLLEVSTATQSWNAMKLPIQNSKHGCARRAFFAQGISRQTGISAGEILNNYEQRVVHERGHSDVPDTEAVVFKDGPTGARVQSVRYYRWPAFLEWLKGLGFKVVSEQNLFFEGQERGTGTVLLQPK